MKVYLVVDSYQYDGGVDILSSHLNAGDAVEALQVEREKARTSYPKIYGSPASRVDAIYIQEIEPK